MQPKRTWQPCNLICCPFKGSIITFGCIQHFIIPTVSQINDKTIGNFNSTFRCCHHRQLLICNDAFQTYMALFHNMRTWCSSFRQIPLISLSIIIQPHLSGCTCKRKMRFRHDFRRLLGSFRCQIPYLLFSYFLIRSRLRFIFCQNTDCTKTLPP